MYKGSTNEQGENKTKNEKEQQTKTSQRQTQWNVERQVERKDRKQALVQMKSIITREEDDHPE